jgi:L-threonylcarbamoyladenylate synthase
VPIAAPSANPSGRLSPTLARHVADELNGVFVIDGGPTTHGLESTVVDTTGPVPMLLRAGALDRAAIESMVGPLANPVEGAPRSPGMLTRHYAPRRPLRLNVEEVRPGETLLAFGPAPPAAATMRNLSPRGDLVEAAANLFAMLHELEQVQCTAIAVMPIPNHGLGEAINDRLTRAAQGL